MLRRAFLNRLGAGLGAPAAAILSAAPKLKITGVRASTFPLLPASRFGKREFRSDFDPARKRWFGPFSQLAGSILVRLDTDAGVSGFGMGGGGSAAVHIIDAHLKDLLLGVNPLNIELLFEQMFAATSFYGRRGVVIMAMSGIDLALWDILGKVAGLPVYRLLGGANKEKARGYYTYTSGKLEDGLELGFTAFKIPVNTGPEEGTDGMRRLVAALGSARRVIGPDALLMIDCLCRWDVPYTLEFAERALDADLRLAFIEEPLLPDDLTGYERLCREVQGTRIASGEHEYTRHGFRILLRHSAAHILQPDVTWSGGLTEGRAVASLAAEEGVPVYPHRGGSLFGIHLVLAHANCTLAESFGTGERGNEAMHLLSPPFADGYYLAPERPGIGAELDPPLLRRLAPSLA